MGLERGGGGANTAALLGPPRSRKGGQILTWSESGSDHWLPLSPSNVGRSVGEVSPLLFSPSPWFVCRAKTRRGRGDEGRGGYSLPSPPISGTLGKTSQRGSSSCREKCLCALLHSLARYLRLSGLLCPSPPLRSLGLHARATADHSLSPSPKVE